MITAGLIAILLALCCSLQSGITKIAIFIDCLSAIQTLNNYNSSYIIYEILYASTSLFTKDVEVILEINKCMDSLAKIGLNLPHVNISLVHSLTKIVSKF